MLTARKKNPQFEFSMVKYMYIYKADLWDHHLIENQLVLAMI